MELRFEIKPEGNYTNTLYTIRYFQYDGEGTLKLVDGPVLTNNDRVLLESKTLLPQGSATPRTASLSFSLAYGCYDTGIYGFYYQSAAVVIAGVFAVELKPPFLRRNGDNRRSPHNPLHVVLQ